MNFKLTEDLKDKVVEFYLSRPMSLDTASYKFRICKPKIVEILKSRNIEIYTKNQIFNPNFDERYFQNIDSEIKAYFLGLIFTDGNVFIKENECSKKITQVSLTLKDEDRYILEILRKELKTNRVITSDNRGSLTLSVRSNLMGEDLKKYNIVPNKSLTIHFPEIDENLKKYFNHFLRGIFDGDGSIQFRIGDKRVKYSVGLSAGNPIVLEQIRDILVDELKLFPVSVYEYSNKYTCMLTWQSAKDMFKICEYLYKDSTIYLERKRKIYDDFKQYYFTR